MGGGFSVGSGTFVMQPDGDIEADAEELRRRAREWVNKTVPMQTVEDELDSPVPKKGPKKKAEQQFDVWDSDEEGVKTRIRTEAQPEAGAGGPTTPYFMQVLGKQWGNKDPTKEQGLIQKPG